LWFSISSYHIASRGDVPVVVTTGTRIKATPDATTYILDVYFKNDGKVDATGIKLQAGTIESDNQPVTTLAPAQNFSRLKAQLPSSTAAHLSIRKMDLRRYIVICISYTDDSSDRLEPSVTFYYVPAGPPVLNGTEAVPGKVSAQEQDALSSGSSCTKM
jgi:hypothetical protein